MAGRSLAPLVLIAAATGAAAGWLAAVSADRATPPTANSDSRAIVEELQGLRAELRTLATRPAAAAPGSPASERTDAAPTSTATPLSTSDARLLSAIEQLAIRVEQIATRQVADNGTLQRLAADRPVDTRALGELQRHVNADWTAAQRDIFLMPMAVVLQRFGPPDYVRTDTNGWVYEFEDHDQRNVVCITFHDGVVVRVD